MKAKSLKNLAAEESSEEETLKFLADAMLGKLSRWLRMLGQNVEYNVKLTDNQLLAQAKAEGRVLLTRDFELYQRALSRGLEAFYLQGNTETERLAELSKRFGLPLEIDMDNSHCPRCNAKLQSTSKDQIREDVETNTFLYYDKFWKCPNCGHVYWQGAHWKQITATLQVAKENLKKKESSGL
jgi:uncharacterized protein with PIN domain